MIKKVGMIVRFNVINYLIGEGIKNLFKNKKSTISSLMIMCATMLIFGLFFVIGENINAFVENVVTHKDYRGKGYATQCLDYAKKIAEKENCYKMMLLTGSKEKSTLEFYKRAGYNSSDKTAFIRWLE